MIVIKRKPVQVRTLPYGGVIVPYMTVDPGLGGTGWAAWTPTIQQNRMPIKSGSISALSLQEEWQDRARCIAQELQRMVEMYQVRKIFLELPRYMEGGVGITAARRGDLIKLAITTGIIIGYCCRSRSPYAVDQCAIAFIEIPDWKGNLEKKMCNDRCRKIMDQYDFISATDTSHEWDAIGMGLYIQGRF